MREIEVTVKLTCNVESEISASEIADAIHETFCANPDISFEIEMD